MRLNASHRRGVLAATAVLTMAVPWLTSCGDDPVHARVRSAGSAAASAGQCPKGTSVDLQDPAPLMARQTFRRLDPTAEGRAAGDGSVTVEIDGGSISVAESTWDLFTAIADPTGAWVGTAGDGGALIIAAVEGEEPFVVGTCMAESYTPFLRSALEAVGAKGADDGIVLLDEAVAQGASSKLVTPRARATRAGSTRAIRARSTTGSATCSTAIGPRWPRQ